ncbi:MAG TPA: aromatic amino acid transport family protein [Parachlamydiaceae bacterium]|nr:aromatic amino acid transport family protein [Parachlamydiaceae bacterium]
MNTNYEAKSGSLFGAILLIAGCCIGAGMLGLPVISAVAGFKPSLAMFLLSWVFMTTTALLLLEVNLWFSDEVSIISMADRTLWVTGKIIGWLCFVFLFYALGVAYIAGSGELIAGFIQSLTGFDMPQWAGSLIVCAIFGIFVYLGTRAVDLFNRVLMTGLVLTYILLVVLGSPYVEVENLRFQNWSAAALVLPVMIISFGFHNLVPSLTTYLNGDVKRLRLAIICGSCLALSVYLVWEWLILGLVPVNEEGGFLQVIDEGSMATELLKNAVGALWIVDVAQYFAFFAILTSFLGNSLSFVDFLSDGLKIKKDVLGKIGLCLLVIVPPYLLSLLYPRIFLSALNYAGAFGAVILFGIMPALMVWAGRYHKGLGTKPIVPGGKLVLLGIIVFAVWIMSMQLLHL